MSLRIVAVVSVLCAVVAVGLRSQFRTAAVERRAAARESGVEPLTPPENRRATEQTFLTFPEWFLVYSPDEYADFVRGGRPSAFPYRQHVAQFWQGYRFLYGATKDDYPPNPDYHVMIWVIGGSTTVEYGLKWLYETTVGRITETTRFGGLTAEDELAAHVAREYVDFLDVEPWYRFDFLGPLRRLWTTTGLWGPDPLRKSERKYFLTTEYLTKAAYGWAIKRASESSYGIEPPTTTVVLDRLPDAAGAELPPHEVRRTFADGSLLVDLPRYQAFTGCAETLARHGVDFVEIAGNRGPILVTALVPDATADPGVPVLMTQPILTRSGVRRIAFTVPVADLTTTLADLNAKGVVVEHVYDY